MDLIPVYPAIDFQEIRIWSDRLNHTIDEFKGHTILLDFWTYSCIYCLRMIPVIKSLKAKYNDVIIISIHSAEYEFAKDIDNIDWAIKYYNISDFLTGYDLKNKTWNAYGNSYWPKFILIDKYGNVRYEHAGYGESYEFDEAIIDVLETSSSKIFQKKNTDLELFNNNTTNQITNMYGNNEGISREICVGYSRLKRFGNNQKAKVDEYNIFTDSINTLDNVVYLEGMWKWEKEGIRISSDFLDDASIIFRYNNARNVNAIISSTDNKPALAEIRIDGRYLNENEKGYHTTMDGKISLIETTRPIIYNIIKTTTKSSHELKISPLTDNFYFYTLIVS